jgi:hypothetical protein
MEGVHRVPSQQRQEASKSQDRRPSALGKPRPEQQHQRPPQESRRKRGEHRASSWGDDIDRAWCTKALAFLPETFPAESHAGAATIPPTIVERRDQMVLLCNYSHSGEHEWPALNALLRGGDTPPDADTAES